MFKTIFGLAFQGVKRRRRQSLLIFFVLLVSFTFAIILLSYTSSIAETNTQLRYDTYGWWYGAITDTNESTKEYLESTEWVDEVGTSISCSAMLLEASSNTNDDTTSYTIIGNIDIGSVDDNLIDMGITTDDGGLPEKVNEIAIESATLSELGFNIGKTITVQFDFYNDLGYYTIVQREFKIVGAVSEYTGLWDVDCTLNTAIISEEAMAEIIAEAKANLSADEITGCEISYFFTVKSGMEESVEKEVNSYLYKNREGYTLKTVTINPVVDMESEAAQTNMVYLGLILAITILAVVMIYILQMQVEVKRIVRFRSIGGSKWQLRLLILTETLMLAIPAVIFGIVLGFLGIKALLAISVYSGSTEIIVSIPWNYLGIALAFWIVGILAARMITFQVALATPLAGRMGIQRSKNRVVVGFRKVLIMLMATLLCVSAVFTTANIAEPLGEYNYWTSLWSYYICEDDKTNTRSDFTLANLSEYESLFLSAPGVSDFVGLNRFYALVRTADDDATSSAVVITMDWDDVQKYVDTTGVDQEAYEGGESVIVQVASGSKSEAYTPAESSDMTIYIDYEHFTEYSPGSDLFGIHFDPTLTSSSLESSGLVSVQTNVGSVQVLESDETLVSLLEYDRAERYSLEDYTYFVICSLPLLQNIVDQIPEGTQWWIEDESFFRGQQEVGYTQAFVYTSMNAGDLAADAAISNIMEQIVYERYVGMNTVYFDYCALYNFREINYANAQVYQQSMIMTIISGVCIAIVVLLILVSTLRLETDSEKRRYGILQAIGMSKRQRNIELARRAVIRSVISIAVAVVSYLAYYLLMNISVIVEGTSPIAVLGTMFTTLAGYGLTVPVLLGILVIVFLVTFAICFGTKLSINKYTIMEMLREDR
ncbi:MAG: ABC transporter permease [Oscillospiraceae bacterium]|nr:ABC transporter permease [Oscillospiraceae bacterium]